jgi:hypothetical protein
MGVVGRMGERGFSRSSSASPLRPAGTTLRPAPVRGRAGAAPEGRAAIRGVREAHVGGPCAASLSFGRVERTTAAGADGPAGRKQGPPSRGPQQDRQRTVLKMASRSPFVSAYSSRQRIAFCSARTSAGDLH